jgi:hypothetical protein
MQRAGMEIRGQNKPSALQQLTQEPEKLQASPKTNLVHLGLLLDTVPEVPLLFSKISSLLARVILSCSAESGMDRCNMSHFFGGLGRFLKTG